MSDHEYKFYQPGPAAPRGDPRAGAGARRALAGRAPAAPAPAGLHRRPADPVPRSQGSGTGADAHGLCRLRAAVLVRAGGAPGGGPRPGPRAFRPDRAGGGDPRGCQDAPRGGASGGPGRGRERAARRGGDDRGRRHGLHRHAEPGRRPQGRAPAACPAVRHPSDAARARLSAPTNEENDPMLHECRPADLAIVTDPSRLDLDVIHGFLSRSSYWAAGIPRELVARALRHSTCFGAFDGNEQVGFARVISDHATFAYVCDVFVLDSHRGRGVGKQLMAAVKSHPDLQGLRRWVLFTRDAHELYRQFGFSEARHPDRLMEIQSGPYPAVAAAREGEPTA